MSSRKLPWVWAMKRPMKSAANPALSYSPVIRLLPGTVNTTSSVHVARNPSTSPLPNSAYPSRSTCSLRWLMSTVRRGWRRRITGPRHARAGSAGALLAAFLPPGLPRHPARLPLAVHLGHDRRSGGVDDVLGLVEQAGDVLGVLCRLFRYRRG